MSSGVVREFFYTQVEAWLNATHPAWTFIDSINQDTEDAVNTADYYVTLDFVPEFSERLALGCSDRQETGSCDVYFFARAGQGYNTAIDVADDFIAAIEGAKNPTGTIIIDSVDPPREVIGTDVQRWYGIYVGTDYIYNS